MIRVQALEGFYHIPLQLMMKAGEVEKQDNQANEPGFKRKVIKQDATALFHSLTTALGTLSIEAVLFGCVNGSQPHVDRLDPRFYGAKTLLLPLILPTGESILRVGNDKINLNYNIGYLFDHTVLHSIIHETNGQGCTLLMATEALVPTDPIYFRV